MDSKEEWQESLKALKESGGTEVSKRLADELHTQLLHPRFLEEKKSEDSSELDRYMIIFLDVDGVIKTNWGDHLPYPVHLDRLKFILDHLEGILSESSESEPCSFDKIGIVLSTTWRVEKDELFELLMCLEKGGIDIEKYFIGNTPRWRFHCLCDLEAVYREVEIDSWLTMIRGTFSFERYYDMSKVTDSDWEDEEEDGEDDATATDEIPKEREFFEKKKEDEDESSTTEVVIPSSSSATEETDESSKKGAKWLIHDPTFLRKAEKKFRDYSARKKDLDQLWFAIYKNEWWKIYQSRLKIANFVVLEDTKLNSYDGVISHQVRPDKLIGLTDEDVDFAISILRGELFRRSDPVT